MVSQGPLDTVHMAHDVLRAVLGLVYYPFNGASYLPAPFPKIRGLLTVYQPDNRSNCIFLSLGVHQAEEVAGLGVVVAAGGVAVKAGGAGNLNGVRIVAHALVLGRGPRRVGVVVHARAAVVAESHAAVALVATLTEGRAVGKQLAVVNTHAVAVRIDA